MKQLSLLLFSVAMLVMLTGCATTADKTAAANAHYTAQEAFTKAQKPIFEMEGIEGEQIRLSGVKALRVYASGGAQGFQAAPVEANPFVESLKVAKDLAIGLAPYGLGAVVVKGFRDVAATGRGATTTTTTTNSANQANVSTTTSTTGANSVIGSGSASVPSTATTTSTTTAPHGACTTGSC